VVLDIAVEDAADSPLARQSTLHLPLLLGKACACTHTAPLFRVSALKDMKSLHLNPNENRRSG